MFLRLVGFSFLRRKRRRAVILAAVALGTSAAAALVDIALDVDNYFREFPRRHIPRARMFSRFHALVLGS